MTIEIDQKDIYREVAMTTGYTGGKMAGDQEAYDRIFTKKEDEEKLARFWDEARSELTGALRGLVGREEMLAASGDEGPRYRLTLMLSASHDDTLDESMRLGVRSYFVLSVTAKWFVYTNKGEAAGYDEMARATLEEVRQKAYTKRSPGAEPEEVL